MAEILRIITNPGPDRHGFWCKGSCGKGLICSDLTYSNGYCISPMDRVAALEKKAADYELLIRENTNG